ncbi:MAG TPA: sigma-70 family RNA polymerase sigma factor [Ignavibacteriaceae bacterium]|nr:sigma-70 family RNA polymerase sigma factor [Ignavibacteriaceae bacterium]
MTKEAALDKVVKQEKGKLLSFIRRRVATKEDAEDILQDVLYSLVSGFEEIEFVERISAWLIKVAKNRIIDSYRKKKTAGFSDEIFINEGSDSDEVVSLSDIMPDFSNLPDEIYWQNLFWEEIEAALEELPPEQKDVFVMNEFEGMSFKEISGIKGETVNTLLSRKRYAVLYLRKKLKNLYKEL